MKKEEGGEEMQTVFRRKKSHTQAKIPTVRNEAYAATFPAYRCRKLGFEGAMPLAGVWGLAPTKKDRLST